MKQKYQLQTLTPVHIGSGETLNQIDGYYANGRWYRIDLDRVLRHPSTDLNALTSEMSQRGFRWTEHLSRQNMDPSELSAYSLACPQSPEEVEIREAIKTVDNRPYIPGSTLKGAIRTALLGDILSKNEEVFDENNQRFINIVDQAPRGNPRTEYPAQQIERSVFGKDPNHDLFRALHVSDTAPLESDALEIGTAWTVTLNSDDQLVQKIDRGRPYKNFVQQIRAEQRLTFTLKTDELLFREAEKNRLDFKDFQEQSLRTIAEACSSLASDILATELEFFDIYDLDEIAQLYMKLEDLNNDLENDAFLLQIGWGTGYHANTITGVFANNFNPHQEMWMKLRKRFQLGESRSRRGQYDKREFPKTRRVLYRGRNPISTLGWVKITPIND